LLRREVARILNVVVDTPHTLVPSAVHLAISSVL
jgi:hypothetical protein